MAHLLGLDEQPGEPGRRLIRVHHDVEELVASSHLLIRIGAIEAPMSDERAPRQQRMYIPTVDGRSRELAAACGDGSVHQGSVQSGYRARLDGGVVFDVALEELDDRPEQALPR